VEEEWKVYYRLTLLLYFFLQYFLNSPFVNIHLFLVIHTGLASPLHLEYLERLVYIFFALAFLVFIDETLVNVELDFGEDITGNIFNIGVCFDFGEEPTGDIFNIGVCFDFGEDTTGDIFLRVLFPSLLEVGIVTISMSPVKRGSTFFLKRLIFKGAIKLLVKIG
jgi:hypothetical protein